MILSTFFFVGFLSCLRIDVVKWSFMKFKYLIPFSLSFMVFGELYKVSLCIITGWMEMIYASLYLILKAWHSEVKAMVSNIWISH